MTNRIVDVYQMFADVYSKEIYGKRVLFSLTNDDKYIQDLLYEVAPIKWLRNKLKELSSKNVLLYGAGIRGEKVSKICPDLFQAIIDGDANKQGRTINGLKVYSLHEAVQHFQNMIVVITNKYSVEDITYELIDNGISKENIIDLGSKISELTRLQYFDLEELRPKENEVFVDCGAFDGDSVFAFMKWCNNMYKHIYCFEPDKNNYMLCKENLNEQSGKITVINKGTWSCETELSFSDTSDVASHICEDGLQRIKVVSLDKALRNEEKVTFIKMDIEGAELETLKGAKQIITEQKPKLAICVYHKKEDIFTIPEYIRSLNPEYKFYLRHYTLAEWDTVLYAIP